jgi:hypothetical protein
MIEVYYEEYSPDCWFGSPESFDRAFLNVKLINPEFIESIEAQHKYFHYQQNDESGDEIINIVERTWYGHKTRKVRVKTVYAGERTYFRVRMYSGDTFYTKTNPMEPT